MSQYLFAPPIALLEILVPKKISSKRRHWLNVPSCNFIQILKLLQDRTEDITTMHQHTTLTHDKAHDRAE